MLRNILDIVSIHITRLILFLYRWWSHHFFQKCHCDRNLEQDLPSTSGRSLKTLSDSFHKTGLLVIHVFTCRLFCITYVSFDQRSFCWSCIIYSLFIETLLVRFLFSLFDTKWSYICHVHFVFPLLEPHYLDPFMFTS